MVAYRCLALRPTIPWEKAKVTLTRYSSVEPDFDNLVNSFKSCMDGLKDGGVIADDKRENVGQPNYLWFSESPRCGYVTIEVEEVK